MSLKTGYVLVKIGSIANTAKVTVNDVEVASLAADFAVSVKDRVVATDNTGKVVGEWGPTTAQPIVTDITLP